MRRALVLPLALVFGVAASRCLEPTEMNVVIDTDIDCARLHEVDVVASGPTAPVNPTANAVGTCVDSKVGNIVLVPSDPNTPVLVQVIAGVGNVSTATCLMDSATKTATGGCVVARRAFRYLAHTPARLPITLYLKCVGVPCGATETCNQDGDCVSAQTGCAGANCDVDASTPKDAAPLTAVQVAAGSDFSCALLSDGTVWCWGGDANGQLGDGQPHSSRNNAARIDSLSNVIAIASSAEGAHACAIVTPGDVWCWGRGSTGQLGNNSMLDARQPVQVNTFGPVTALALGFDSTSALLVDGAILRWGANEYLQLNLPVQMNPVPIPEVARDPRAKAIALGYYHSCSVTSADTIGCTGNNEYGQLGDGSAMTKSTFTQLTTSNIKTIAAGGYTTCAISNNGELMCWGDNTTGKVGVGAMMMKPPAPLILPSPMGVKAVSVGDSHTCAIAAGDAAYCWGNNKSAYQNLIRKFIHRSAVPRMRKAK